MLNFSSDEFYSTDSVVLFIDFFKEFFFYLNIWNHVWIILNEVLFTTLHVQCSEELPSDSDLSIT